MNNQFLYKVGLIILLLVSVYLAWYSYDVQRRYKTFIKIHNNEIDGRINQLETEKDSIKEQVVLYKDKFEESQAKVDSISTLYNLKVEDAYRYYEKYKELKASTDTLNHGERVMGIRAALAKRLNR